MRGIITLKDLSTLIHVQLIQIVLYSDIPQVLALNRVWIIVILQILCIVITEVLERILGGQFQYFQLAPQKRLWYHYSCSSSSVWWWRKIPFRKRDRWCFGSSCSSWDIKWMTSDTDGEWRIYSQLPLIMKFFKSSKKIHMIASRWTEQADYSSLQPGRMSWRTWAACNPSRQPE